MNKKLIIGGMLGLVAIGAGAFAVAGIGGAESDDAQPRQARTQTTKGSLADPLVFEADGHYFAAIGDGKVVKLPDTAQPAGGSGEAPASKPETPSAPSTGGGTTEDGDEDEPTTPASDPPGTDDQSEPGDEPQNYSEVPESPTPGDEGDEPDIIWSPELADAICEIIGCEGEPEIIYSPDLTDSICKMISCASGDEDEDDEPHILVDRACEVLGTCRDSIVDIINFPRIPARQ